MSPLSVSIRSLQEVIESRQLGGSGEGFWKGVVVLVVLVEEEKR